jgi:exodeoxyribonuclease V beta subunit
MNAAEIHRLSIAEYESEWQALVEQLVAWRDEWVRRGFMRMVQGMLAVLRTSERLLVRDDGERRLTNLRHAVELLHTATMEERLSPEGLLLWVGRTRATGEEKAERTELRLESDADAVQIVTIHKSKGLEYDVVFCPGLFATRRTGEDEPVLVHENGTIVFDHGSPQRKGRGRLAAAEELAEELRLVYVALTRARLRCYVAWGAVTNSRTKVHAGNTALGYLLHSRGVTGEPEELAESVPAAFARSLAEFELPLRALVESSKGTMTIEPLAKDQEAAGPWAGADAPRAAPVCRIDLPPDDSLRSWRVASFTSLTAGRHAEDARDVADHGAGEREQAPVLRLDNFMAFPAGRQPGIALHELFERVDFAAPPAEVHSLATEILQRFRLVDHDDRILAATTMAARVLGAPLPGAGFALRDVPRNRTLREWTFHLPLGMVQRNTFADAFGAHGGELAKRYAPSLRQLSAERTQGFLTGVVDLAFEQGGRWYVVDWKSNHLGTDPSRYEGTTLEREMFSSHYVLQYHLYLTALHRFLRVRLPGYDYDSHIGGAWYAFLRGIDGTERGWFHDRPPRALIDTLDALMDDSAALRQVRA